MASNTTRKTKTNKNSSATRKKAPVKAAKNTRPTPKTKKPNQYGLQLGDEIAALAVIAFTIILVLSNFGICGSIGEVIKSVGFGLFGVVEYVAPFILAASICIMIANKQMSVVKIKSAAAYCMSILLCALVQTIWNKPDITEAGIGDFYIYSSNEFAGGGFFGGLISKILSPLGTAGAIVIIILLMIICIVIITERSFLNGVRDKGAKAYSNARKDYADYKQHSGEVRQRRQERQKQLQLEHEENVNKRKISAKSRDAVQTVADEPVELKRTVKKVKGVPLDTTIAGETSSYEVNPIDIHEIEVDTNILDEFTDDIYDPLNNVSESKQNKMTEINDTIVSESTHEPELMSDVPKRKENIPVESKNNDIKPDVTKPDTAKSVAAKTDDIVVKNDKTDSKHSTYKYPPITLLDRNVSSGNSKQQSENKQTAVRLQQTLQNFGVKVTITDISCGPSVTRFELQPEQGIKVSKIVSLADDIKLNLAAADIRIEAPIPGKAAIGIEVPNKESSSVSLRELIETDTFKKHKSDIAFAAGRDISGQIIVADIAKMPHLLIAGATGSGKSVCINTIIMSILYKANPDDVKLIMVDPKVVELSVYNGIPHLLIPVVTDPKKAAGALNWAVAEMTERYKKFAELQVRDLKGYNEKIATIDNVDSADKPVKMPQIVIIVDELADLMMVASGEVEDAIVRLAQLARAAGIHLVIATQRPSVNVITGLIKANVPSRIAFSVSSGVDSRTILDMNGAEKLLGKGDMLFYPSGYPKPVRVQGAFVSDKEVGKVVEFLKENTVVESNQYSTEITSQIESSATMSDSQAFGGERDQYFAETGRFIIEKEKGSIGMLQRYYKIGFNRAARIMDQLCDAGVVGPEEGTKPRKILMTMEEFEEYLNQNK